jgi:hypothetical protein
MANPNAVVSRVLPLSQLAERAPAEALRSTEGAAISLEDGRRARLDPDDPRSAQRLSLLAGLSQLGIPVYLEIDPESSIITRLLIPTIARVVDIRTAADGSVEVLLEPSHARHVLPDDQPAHDEYLQALRAAQRSGEIVAVTGDDANAIIDIRTYRPSPDGPDRPLPLPLPDHPRFDWRHPLRGLRNWLHRLWYWRWWPWWWCWWRCVSPARAQEIFDAMNATSCQPLTVPAPCIPFLYPENGCWARAHEMRRLMLNMGHSSRKVWIHGALQTPTKNSPNCEVLWGWHVAPTLCVRYWLLFARRMVIDPSLFAAPITKATWKSVQGDPAATLNDTHGSIYYFPNTTDPTYSDTNHYLAHYRAVLQNRSINQGPPPYAHCA